MAWYEDKIMMSEEVIKTMANKLLSIEDFFAMMSQLLYFRSYHPHIIDELFKNKEFNDKYGDWKDGLKPKKIIEHEYYPTVDPMFR